MLKKLRMWLQPKLFLFILRMTVKTFKKELDEGNANQIECGVKTRDGQIYMMKAYVLNVSKIEEEAAGEGDWDDEDNKSGGNRKPIYH
jgi:hypothetical protein